MNTQVTCQHNSIQVRLAPPRCTSMLLLHGCCWSGLVRPVYISSLKGEPMIVRALMGKLLRETPSQTNWSQLEVARVISMLWNICYTLFTTLPSVWISFFIAILRSSHWRSLKSHQKRCKFWNPTSASLHFTWQFPSLKAPEVPSHHLAGLQCLTPTHWWMRWVHAAAQRPPEFGFSNVKLDWTPKQKATVSETWLLEGMLI